MTPLPPRSGRWCGSAVQWWIFPSPRLLSHLCQWAPEKGLSRSGEKMLLRGPSSKKVLVSRALVRTDEFCCLLWLSGWLPWSHAVVCCACGGQKTTSGSQSSHPTMWIAPGLNFCSSSLAAIAFVHWAILLALGLSFSKCSGISVLISQGSRSDLREALTKLTAIPDNI